MAFLVIEGLDGSGKSTQIRLFREYLENKGIKYRYIHFPRTGSGLFGELISMFLRGELGKIDEVNPYLAALIYADDRNDAKSDMIRWLAEGGLLLVDRYVVSNIAFQCAKMKNPDRKRELRDWIYQLEYVNYEIPRPDLNIFLDVPFEFTKEKLAGNRTGKERDYLRGVTDIHEADLEFQQQVRQTYLDESKSDKSLSVVDCYNEKGEMLKPGEIFCKIKNLVKKKKILDI